MIRKRTMTRTLLIGPALGAILGAGILLGCTGDTEGREGAESNHIEASQSISERGEGSGGEHGSGGEGGGEHGSGGESGNESGVGGGEEGSGTGSEAGEAAMSSPIIPLDQSWNGTLGGLAISAQYDAVTRSVQATVQNTLGKTLCYVQAEPHLKSGTRTVGELGPDVLGHLSPGQQATSSVSVASEPALAGVSFDGYVVHMEVFDCSGPGPVPHTGGEGAGGEKAAARTRWRSVRPSTRSAAPPA